VELARQLRRLLLVVDQGSTARAVVPAVATGRPVTTSLGEHREAAIVEDAELTDDSVAASVSARPA
jgi:hypothetical protein